MRDITVTSRESYRPRASPTHPLPSPRRYYTDDAVDSSQLHASDMFYTAFEADPMNRAVGLRFRREVLERGGSEDEMGMVRSFLGRETSEEGWFGELRLV